jgi:hypothetical protein
MQLVLVELPQAAKHLAPLHQPVDLVVAVVLAELVHQVVEVVA